MRRRAPRATPVHCLVVAIMTLFLVSCATTGDTPADAQILTVEGGVTVRGNEPFTDLFLETDQRNSYVLKLEADERREMQRAAPGQFRVSGRLYRGDWNGLPYAFIEVADWSRL